jgi:putative membrane protein
MKLNKKNRSLFDYLILSAKGFCMGASDVIPGVSGGTMAFILGIYEELINAIKSFDLKAFQLLMTLKFRALLDHVSWKFLLSLGIGILAAIFSLAKVLSWLLHNQPVLIWSFFFGLILASVVSVSRRIQAWRVPVWLSLFGGTTGAYLLVGFVPVSTPNDPWFLFLSGAIAICAMILPGISGSFILVLLGKYMYVLEAVNNRDFLVLFLVALGACVGIVAFSRLLGWLLNNYHDLMVALLTGLMLGSLRKIWPWKETIESRIVGEKVIPIVQSNVLPEGFGGEVVSALCLMVMGLLAVLLLDRMGNSA